MEKQRGFLGQLFNFWGENNWIFKHVLLLGSPWAFVSDQRKSKYTLLARIIFSSVNENVLNSL